MQYIGLTLADLLFILFLGLKLAEVITWSWGFVFMPLYLPYVLGFFVRTFKNYKIKKKLSENGTES